MKEYEHLNIIEREKIAILKAKGYSNREIGRRLNRSHTTIGREVIKLGEEDYSPSKSEDLYKERRKNTGRKPILENNVEALEYAEQKLNIDRWLPDEVANRSKLEEVHSFSTSTLYRAISKGLLDIDVREILKFKGKKKKSNSDKRGQIPDRKFLDERPEEANNREKIGHWEADLVISKGKKGGLLTLIDRYSRYSIVEKVEDKKAETIIEAFKRGFKGIPEEYLRTITVDNGKEFAGFKEVEKELSVEIYFCAPYSPWEKGSNENFNGILRQFYPKKTDFSNVTKNEIDRVVNLIRNRPRKVLGYFTSKEIFWEKVKWCT